MEDKPLRNGDLALVAVKITDTVTGPPTVARYADDDQAQRDAGDDPEDLVTPYWMFFGSDFTEPPERVQVIWRLRLVDEAGNHVQVLT